MHPRDSKRCINQKELKEFLSYHADTGIFIWNKRVSQAMKAGYIAGTSYGRNINIAIHGLVYQAHRLAWLYVTGEWPDIIDHINHDSKDNRWVNLRSVTHQENMMNTSIRKDNSSGVTGVYWNKKSNKWRAVIQHEKKKIYLGEFNDKDMAIKHRRLAEKKYGFHANHGL